MHSYFSFQNTNPVRAHKYMLISRSPVFCAMFTGAAKDESGKIHIQDVEREIFKNVLR